MNAKEALGPWLKRYWGLEIVMSDSHTVQLSDAAKVCAEAYQVVGSLLSDLGQFTNPHAVKILDNLSQARLVHDDVLPWPSFEKTPMDGPLAIKTDPELLAQIKAAVGRSMTPDEWFEQRVSFVYSTCHGNITKDQVRQALRDYWPLPSASDRSENEATK